MEASNIFLQIRWYWKFYGKDGLFWIDSLAFFGYMFFRMVLGGAITVFLFGQKLSDDGRVFWTSTKVSCGTIMLFNCVFSVGMIKTYTKSIKRKLSTVESKRD